MGTDTHKIVANLTASDWQRDFEDADRERRELLDILDAIRSGQIDTILAAEGSPMLRLLDAKLVEENERLLDEIQEKQDVLEQQKKNLEAAYAAQQGSEDTIRALLDSQLESAMLIEPDGVILALNRMAATQLEGEVDQLVGSSLYSALPTHLQENRRQRIIQAIESGLPVQFEEHNQAAVFDVHLFPIQNSLAEIHQIAIYIRDITVERSNRTKLRDANKQLKYMAMHDSLTGLPNRVMLTEHLTRAVASSKRKRQKFYVLFIDLDHFKNVNDSLGHGIGDILLLEVVHRVREIIRTEDVMARVGGDEFVIVLDTCTSANRAVVVCNKINQVIARQFVISNNEIHISASIGISAYPEDGKDSGELLENADFAMYAAKHNGKNSFQAYQSVTQNN